jgi:anti-sigma factor RsiW
MAGACDSVTRLLSPYFDDALEGADRALVDGHLAGCKDCAARLLDLTAGRGVLQAYFEKQAEGVDFAAFTRNVMAQIKKEPLPFGQRAKLWWAELMAYHSQAIYSGFGAAATAALVAGVWFGAGRGPVAPVNGVGEVAVNSLQVTDARYEPVVMHTDEGDAVIVMVDHDGDGKPDEAVELHPGETHPASPGKGEAAGTSAGSGSMQLGAEPPHGGAL